jgi:hypothetical protein
MMAEYYRIMMMASWRGGIEKKMIFEKIQFFIKKYTFETTSTPPIKPST